MYLDHLLRFHWVFQQCHYLHVSYPSSYCLKHDQFPEILHTMIVVPSCFLYHGSYLFTEYLIPYSLLTSVGDFISCNHKTHWAFTWSLKAGMFPNQLLLEMLTPFTIVTRGDDIIRFQCCWLSVLYLTILFENNENLW